MSKSKICTLTMIYNNDLFLKSCLETIEKISDQIIIVEGSWNPEMPHRSTDNSIQIASDFCSRNKKAKLIFYDADDSIPTQNTVTYRPIVLANEMKARQLGINEFDGDWFFLVDSDEIYKTEDLMKLRNYLDDLTDINEPFMFSIPAFVFYFDYTFGTKESFQRISKIIGPPKLGYTDHLIYDNDTRPINIELSEDMIYMYHYGYIGLDRVKTKMSMWNEKYTDDWYNQFVSLVESKTFSDEHNYHLFKKMGYGSKFEFFKGEHPECIKLLMEIKNEQKI